MEKTKLGVVGCGTIAEVYVDNLVHRVSNVDVVACNDIDQKKAEVFAEKYGIPKACSYEEMLADPEIAVILNLTIPAVHYDLNMKALAAGKHVYCEKPFGVSFEEVEKQLDFAKEKGLILTCAPDTFLGYGVQTARKLMDEGAIGDPVSFTANMMYNGTDLWHPTAEFYYAPGGGPLWDMGGYFLTALTYLVGPIKKISAFSRIGKAERKIHGRMVKVEVPTTYTIIMEMASGAIGNVNMSFDVWHTDCPNIEIFGKDGAIQIPDPNGFGGKVFLIRGKEVEEKVEALDPATEPFGKLRVMAMSTREAYREVTDSPFPPVDRLNMRGVGVSDLCAALQLGRENRVSGEQAKHIAEALEGVEISVREGRPYEMTTSFTRTAPMPQNVELFTVDE
jgi:predicted dehydrogenase